MSTRPALPSVTLVAVSSVALPATLAALKRSCDQADFGRALLLACRAPAGLAGSGIEWRQIEPIRSRADYSRFMLHHLADHVETSHALVVQWDGFVRDGQAWTDDFLNHDYIGAPWPQYRDGMAVGNGGFSLRSRRLLQATRMIACADQPEDVLICRTHRHKLEDEHGLRFANMDVARAFSYERGDSTGAQFGFHGVFNMPAELPGAAFRALLQGLEPGVIGARESGELLVRALRAGDWPLLRQVLAHHHAHPGRARRLLRALGWLLTGRDGSPVPRGERG